jgi:hypothetical protein
METSSAQKPHPMGRLLRLGVPLAIVAVAALMLRVFNPATCGFFPPCPFRELTGYLCPGCGTTRALHQLLTGHVAAAFRLNPLMMLLLPYVGYSAAASLLETAGGRSLPTPFIQPVFIWTLLAVIILFWILRNIPAFAAMLRG